MRKALGFRRVALLTAAWAFLAIPLAAQTMATLLGTVTDSSGAVLPGTSLTVVNEERQWSHTYVTDGFGHYRILDLPIGRYTITARKEGFKKVTIGSLVLQAGQERVQDIMLEVGAVETTVEVHSETVQLMTLTSAQRSEVISTQQLVELPVPRRDFTSLVLLTPGAVADVSPSKSNWQPGSGQMVAVNGQRGNLSSFEIDGSRAVDLFWGGLSFIGYNLDAIAEFRVTSNNYSAAQAGGSSSLTQVITKSGTNQFHGTAFEFLRNDVLDARNFFSTRKSPLRQNEFGGVIGGPIRRDRKFFFVEYTGFRNPSGPTSNLRVPTANQRNGSLTGTNPLTGRPDTFFVPVNAAAKPFLDAYPLPNNPSGPFGANTYTANVPRNITRNQTGVRSDHRLSKNDFLYGRYTWARAPITTDSAFGHTWDSTNLYANKDATLNYTRILSPRMSNEVKVGYDRFVWNQYKNIEPTGGDKNSGAQLPDGSFDAIPGGDGIPIALHMYQGSLDDNVTMVLGRHTIKTGISYMFQGDNGCGAGPAWGVFRFFVNNPINTAIPTASGTTIPAGSLAPLFPSFVNLLLANPSDVNLNFGIPGTAHPCTGRRDMRRKIWAGYLQDDIKATGRLTLNVGLRYEYPTVITDARGGGTQAALDPSHPLWSGSPAIILNPHPNYASHAVGIGPFGPRLGFAFQVQRNTVIRGGGAIRAVIPPFVGISQGFRSFPDFAQAPLPGTPLQYNARQWVQALMAQLPPLRTLSGSPVNLSNRPPNTPIVIGPYTPIVGQQIITNINPNFRSGYVGDWSLTLEHQFPREVVGSVAYVGSSGVGLMGGEWPYGYAGGNRPQEFLNRYGIAEVDQVGNYGHSTYHGLQTSARKTSARYGLTFQTVYTWSKTLSNVDDAFHTSANTIGYPQDPFKRFLERAPAGFDVRHRVVINAVQDLDLQKLIPGLPRRLTSGWQIAGVFQAQTGLPMTIFSGRIIDGRGIWLRTGNGYARPDQVGPSNAPAGADKTTWFDRNAFSVPVLANGFQARDGYLGRNTMRVPGLKQLDFSLHKTTTLTEKVRLQIRMDAGNIFNWVNLGPPVNLMTSPTFGRILTAGTSRNIQVGVKLAF